MATDVKLPRLGQGMESGVIVRWLKSEGEAVSSGEPLYELDTDKVTQEVEAEVDGTLLKIVVAEGEVTVGSTVAVIGDEAAIRLATNPLEVLRPETATRSSPRNQIPRRPRTPSRSPRPPKPRPLPRSRLRTRTRALPRSHRPALLASTRPRGVWRPASRHLLWPGGSRASGASTSRR